MTGKCKAPGIGTGVAGTIGNVVWFVLAGWWLAIMHISAAVALAIAIIGIPFAWAHVKLRLPRCFRLARRWWRLMD